MQTEHVTWFENERGIHPETLEAFRVTSENSTVVLPYATGGAKHRAGIPHGERKFWFTKGMQPGLFLAPHAESTKTAFLVEGETDTMRLWQEFDGEADKKPMPGIAGLSGVDTWRDELAVYLEPYEAVYVVLDNDQDYMVQGRVENAWRCIRKGLGSKAKRLRLPNGVKDLCEFFELYSLDELRALVTTPAAGVFHYQSLDVSAPPAPPDWLINGLVCKGDVCLMLGEPGVGKSVVSLSVAVAVAEGFPDWLGHRMHGGGRVLVVDEENPVDVAHSRLASLGLTERGNRNLRYLSRQGVRVDKFPERILDDAIAFDPTLIVLDSLTRLHTQDENSAGAMAAVFNDGINPLARETGATVLLLHHANKGDGGSAFNRSRGSSDIVASVDTALDVRASAVDGHVNIVHAKTRRGRRDNTISARIIDKPNGGVDLIRTAGVEVPF